MDHMGFGQIFMVAVLCRSASRKTPLSNLFLWDVFTIFFKC